MSKLTKVLAGVVLVLTVAMAGMVHADEAASSIKDVMKKAHKSGLLKKVVKGEGTAADAKELLALYEAMAKFEPKKGDADSWKSNTTAVVDAAKAVVDGKAGAVKSLSAATSCKGCHNAHK